MHQTDEEEMGTLYQLLCHLPESKSNQSTFAMHRLGHYH